MSQEVSKATPSQGIPSAGQHPPSFQSRAARIADDVVGLTLCHLHQHRKDVVHLVLQIRHLIRGICF